jgi:ketosteroid isomerase-like protein
MSQENVEMVRLSNEAFNRGDIDEVLTYYTQDAEWEDLTNAPDLPPVAGGIEEVRQLLMAWTQAFDEFRAEVAEYIDLDEHVVCVIEYFGRSREGLTIQLKDWPVLRLRDGKIARVTTGYTSREDALEAVRLSEQDAHANSE